MNKSAGYSLVEVMLVIAILMLMMIAGFVLFSKIRDESRANTEAKNLTTIIVGVRNLYGAKHVYTTVDTGTLNRAHIFPRTMNGGNFSIEQVIMHSDGGAVEVLPWGTPPKQFAVVYRAASQSLCNKLALHYSKNVEEVMVGSVMVKEAHERSSDVPETMQACQDAPIDITFIQR